MSKLLAALILSAFTTAAFSANNLEPAAAADGASATKPGAVAKPVPGAGTSTAHRHHKRPGRAFSNDSASTIARPTPRPAPGATPAPAQPK